MPTDTKLRRAYDHCGRITKSRAVNFYYAFRTLPKARRRAIYATYAFCRLCDDIADGSGSFDKKKQGFLRVRRALAQSHKSATADPLFIALQHAAATFHIPIGYFEDVIDGVEMDLTRSRYADFHELEEYCYKVASTVGLISIEIFGYSDPDAKKYAVDLGIAMQLTNILRDIREDASLGRVYIPQDELVSFGYSEDELRAEVVNKAFRDLMEFQVARAREYFDSGRRLMPLLNLQSRACPAVLLAVYSRILGRIESSGFDIFEHRIGLNTVQKLLMMVRLWATSLLPATQRLRR